MEDKTEKVLKLAGAQELREMAEVHAQLLEAFEAHACIVLDLDEVTDVDLTLIQLVESARATAAQQGKTFGLTAPASGVVLAALQRGGFLADPADPRSQFWLAA